MRTKKLNDSDLLKVALKVVIEKGPDSFTLKDISKKTKLAPATLLQRFGTRDKLLVAVLKQATNEMKSRLNHTDLTSLQSRGIDGLIDFLCETSIGITTENFAEHLALLAKDFSVPVLRNLSQEHMKEFRKVVQSFLRRARENEELKNDVDLEELALQTEAIYHGAGIQWGFLRQGSLSYWLRDRLDAFFRQFSKK